MDNSFPNNFFLNYINICYNGYKMYHITLIVTCTKITADHDGYCSGEENVESESTVRRHLKIICSHKEYIYLCWLKRYKKLNHLMMYGLYYKTTNHIDGNHSYYCDASSKHRLKHQKLIKMIHVKDIRLSWDTKKHKFATSCPGLTWVNDLDIKYDYLFQLYVLCKVFNVPMDILHYHLFTLF